MPETNDNAAKIALSQDARDSLNAITQEAFANAEYLDSLFDKPQNVNVPPSRRRAIPQTTNRMRQKPRSKPSRSRSSAAFAWLTLGLTATLLTSH